MSLSPEESWLPVASIVLGIIHVQVITLIIYPYPFEPDICYRTLTGL